MKHILKAFTIGCMAILLLNSCFKKAEPEPAKPVPTIDTVLTEEKLIGKWEATDVTFHFFTNGAPSGTSSWTKNIGYLRDNGKVKGWDPAIDVSYLIFTGDHSFSHPKPDVNPTVIC